MHTAVSVVLSIPFSVHREMAKYAVAYSRSAEARERGGAKELTNRIWELRDTSEAWEKKIRRIRRY